MKKEILVLKIAIAMTFIGHGVFALQQKASWIKYFTAVGLSSDFAMTTMPLIGVMDIVVALIILLIPIPVIILWAALWGFITALIRPIGGDPIWDFIERAANWGAPLALLYLLGTPKDSRGWWTIKK